MNRSMSIVLISALLLTVLFTSITYAAEEVTITYTYWGSALEREAQLQMARDFEKAHPNIKVKAIHIPANYEEKINAMVAAGNPPDVAQLAEGTALEWAEKGVVLDIMPLIEKDPDVRIEDRLPVTWYWYGKGKKTIGTNLAAEVMLLWYNKDIFDKAGVAYPPSSPDKPWTWDQFVEAARKLTTDRKGKHPGDPEFDPKNIKTYGVAFGTWWGPILPFVRSNGGDFFNEEGTAPMIDQPESVHAIQSLADLIYKHHVAPTPTQLSTFPAFNILLQTQQVAMVIDGQWALLDLAKSRFKLGVAPLPIFKKPVCLELGAPNVIFSATKHPKEAWEFYKWCTDAERVLPLIKGGLWMPLQTKWYTDPNLLKRWITAGVHPPEYKEAVVDYVLKYASRAPSYYLRNWPKIDTAIYQGLSKVFLGQETAETACKRIAKEIKPLLKGSYDK